MTDELFYVPGGDDSFVELSNDGKRVFRKHILTKGPLYYQDRVIDVNDEFLDTVVKNFNDHVVSHVQAPVVDENNRHTEDPFRNIGEVIKVERVGDKLYSYIDVRDEAARSKMGKTLLGASAQLSLNWKNNKTNKRVGPALVHTAITNNAHLNDLEDFEEVLLSNGTSDSSNNKKAVGILSATPSTSRSSKMERDELYAVALEEFNIDIASLEEKAAKAESYAKLSNDLREKLTSGEDAVLKLSATDEETADEDLVAAVADLVQSRVELSAKVDNLVKDAATARAEARIEELVAGGFISPAKRAENLELLLSNAELFERLVPEKPLLQLSHEDGHEVKDETHDETVTSEIARLSADAAQQGLIK
jgi:hypothetical protein